MSYSGNTFFAVYAIGLVTMFVLTAAAEPRGKYTGEGTIAMMIVIWPLTVAIMLFLAGPAMLWCWLNRKIGALPKEGTNEDEHTNA